MDKNRKLVRARQLEMLRIAFGEVIMGLLYDDNVVEIMLNPDGRIHYETIQGKKLATEHYIEAFQSENIIKLVAAYKNGVADLEAPEVATELPFENARFQGWLPPVVAKSTFAIRRQAVSIFTLEEYAKMGAVSETQVNFLKKAVKSRRNIVVVGGTGSGKTTLCNALLAELKGDSDRILVLEDLPELQVEVEDLVSMTTTPFVNMQQLVRGALRMRPDRIIIGEVRDGAALDLLKAWNTGHPGGLCTIHANSVESTPYRLEDLLQEAVMTVPRNLILQAVDLIVFIKKDIGGKRIISDIVELTGYDGKAYQLKSVQ